MAISRKTFNTVKDILKELDERRSAARPTTTASEPSRNRATPKRLDLGEAPERNGDEPGSRGNGLSDQLIG